MRRRTHQIFIPRRNAGDEILKSPTTWCIHVHLCRRTDMIHILRCNAGHEICVSRTACVCTLCADTHTILIRCRNASDELCATTCLCIYYGDAHTSELKPMPRGGHKYTYIYKWYIFIHSGYRCISRRYIYV